MNCSMSTNKKNKKSHNVNFYLYPVDIRYRETERSRVDFGSHGKKELNISVMSIDKMNSIKQGFLEENFKHEVAQLIFQNKRLNETN